jgi:rSAM/selenodomain-associated transferase 2
MRNSPTISIIIPALNEETHLSQLLPYLIEQGGKHIAEIIIVDGQSTDQTPQIAQKYGAILIASDQRNRAHQMNLGAAAAHGEILYFVHADCLPPQAFSQIIVQHLDTPGKMGCFRYHFRSKKPILRINSWFTRFHFLWCQGGDKTFFLYKSCFEEIKRFDPYYQIMEEYDFLRRAQATHTLSVLPYEASVSARKYERNAWLRVQCANFLVFNGWRLGIAPQKLHKLYKSILS